MSVITVSEFENRLVKPWTEENAEAPVWKPGKMVPRVNQLNLINRIRTNAKKGIHEIIDGQTVNGWFRSGEFLIA